MNIDDAIDYLKNEKKRGVENIIIAWWSADMFKRKDDSAWAEMTGWVDDNMDWSVTHSALEDLLPHSHDVMAADDAED